jgi:hypothetical protein
MANENSEHLAADRPLAKNANCFARWVIYTHVIAVGVCGLLSYYDRHGGMGQLPIALLALLYPLGVWAILSLFAYPGLVVGAILSGRLRGVNAAITFGLEAVIVVAQLIAFLPLVQ